jgi:hypothetical protein
MDNQPYFIVSLKEDEDLINNRPCSTDSHFLPQVHIAHGDADIAMDLNGLIPFDGVVELRLSPPFLNEPIVLRETVIFTYEV